MFSEYKNILANKFMRDTNYIIIKDTDDIEELERQWELFKSCLTVRQQRLSDDRSIEIWNMTNQEHYETLKRELMEELETKLNIDEPVDSIESEDSDDILSNDDFEPDEDFKNYVNIPNDEEIPDEEYDINEPIKEDSAIPTDGKEHVIGDDKDELGLNLDRIKDAQADQYEIDSNINIIGSIRGKTPEEHLENLEKAYAKWNSQNQDHRKKSDDKCREIYGMSNIDRYNMLKASIYKIIPTEKLTAADIDANTVDNIQLPKDESSFIYQVYRNMQVLNEQESNKQKQHRRFNDTPYFTPSEMIDLGVHDNDNFYSFKADNDGLIQGTKIPTWFDSYKDMCLDHIFEDYTKEWIDTLDMLYSDFEQIKESGNEEAILARKQSILDLGWNPEIPFNRRNRLKASKRVNKLLDKYSPMNLFINLDKVVPDDAVSDEPVIENAKSDTHQPIYMVFVQGKAPIISSSIKKVTHSPYSHSGIAFDHTLDTVHSYNMIPDVGLVRETLQGYKDSVITVMAFFAPNKIAQAMKDYVQDFWYNSKKTVYDFGIIFNKLINKNTRVVEDKYHQVCSTFVDAVLKSGNVVIDKTANVPSPAELYNSAKTMPNKIIEVYTGPANEYNANKVGKKIKKLLSKGNVQSIEESASSISTQSDSVNERYIFSEPNYQINIDKWGPGNPLWITGTSGDGKSTLCNKMANERSNSLIVHTDTFLCRVSFTKEKYERKRASWVNNKTVGDEMSYEYIDLHPELEYDMKDKNKNFIDHDKFKKYFTDYAYWIMEQAETNPNYKNKNIIVEGCDICLLDPELMSTKPVIVIGGSRLRTAFRRVKRDIQTDDKSIIEAIFREIKREKSYVNRLNKDKETFLDNLRDLSVNKETSITEGIHDIMNGTNPFSTKTFYHISFDDDLDDEILKPRIPSWITNEVKKNPNFIKELEKLKDSNSTSGTGFEEYMTPRVCFSPSIEGCLNAIINEKGRMHLHNETLYVYIPEKPIKEYKTKTNRQILKDGDIFDANVTQEMWILEPVKLKYVGSIVVDKITGEHIKKFANNKNKTNIKYDYKWHWFHKVKYRYNPEKNKFVTESAFNESISDLESAESNDIYHNIEDWESGKSNVLWVTGLSGSGKSTISKEISAKYNDVEYVELDLIQAGKIRQWDDNDKRLNGLLKDFVDYKGGFDNIFQLYTEKARKGELKFGDMMDKSCADQFNELFEYIITYTKKNSNRRFVIEGVQIAMCTSNKMIDKISKYPVIIKMNGPLKTEFRREKRSIKSHIDQDTDFITTFKHICHHIQNWIKNGFFLNNWKELNYFRTHIGESVYEDITNYKDPCISYAMGVNKSITKLTKQGFNITEDDGDYKVIFDYSNRSIWESFINDNLQDTYWNEYIRLKDITIHFMINEDGKIKHVINKKYESNDSLLKTCNRLCNGDYKDIKSLIYSNDFYKEVLSSHTINESVLNEVKQFPVEFDKEGNLIIYKCRTGSISYGDEIADSVKLLESYRNANNVEGIKYELAKLWFINDSIEKRLKKRLTNDEYKELINQRAICLNVFKLNLEYVMKAEQGFNFSDYYNSTPFSDNSIKITANTIKYSMKALMQI